MDTHQLDTSRFYTGVGSGSTPVEVAPTQKNIAKRAASRGIGLLSGGAWGSDLNYETGAIEAGGPYTVFFANPTHKQNGKYERIRTGANYHLLSNLQHNEKARQVIQQILDASHWGNIEKKGDFVANLMTRNVYQILNFYLRHPTEFVSLWAPVDVRDQSVMGGTKAAAKLASALEIPTYNLVNAHEREVFAEFVRAGMPPRTPQALARTLSRMSDMGIITREEALGRAEALRVALPVTLGEPLPVIMPTTFTAEHLGGAKRDHQQRIFAPGATQESLLEGLAPVRAQGARQLERTPEPTRAEPRNEIDPNQDGITHINVYSRAKTELGRNLTNFAKTPFTLEDDGRFESVEGYWYWLGVDAVNPRRAELRNASGFAAKQLGRDLGAPDWQDSADFKNKITAAINAKLEQNPKIARALAESTLPFRHYYVFSNQINEPQQGRWILEHLEARRRELSMANTAVNESLLGERVELDSKERLVAPSQRAALYGTQGAAQDALAELALAIRNHDRDVITSGGAVWRIGPEDANGARGYGGQGWTITYADGTQRHTTNLWQQDAITPGDTRFPEETATIQQDPFRQTRSDNAEELIQPAPIGLSRGAAQVLDWNDERAIAFLQREAESNAAALAKRMGPAVPVIKKDRSVPSTSTGPLLWANERWLAQHVTGVIELHETKSPLSRNTSYKFYDKVISISYPEGKIRTGANIATLETTKTAMQPNYKVSIGNANRNDIGEYIGRGGRQRFAPSPLRNRYIVGVDGERGECADKFRADLDSVLAGSPIEKSKLWADRVAINTELARLAEKLQTQDLTLICHCAPAKCHGEAVRDAVVALRDRKLGLTNTAEKTPRLTNDQKPRLGQAELSRASGGVFDSQAMAVVNTVNCVGVMGKGLALEFKTRYPHMYADYRKACEGGRVKPGSMHVFDLGAEATPRYIINFPTKRHWRDNSRMEDITSGLRGLTETVKEFGLTSVAIPALGCSNGGLNWNDVEPLIRNAAATMDAQVEIYGPGRKLLTTAIQLPAPTLGANIPATMALTKKNGFFVINDLFTTEELRAIEISMQRVSQQSPFARYEMPNGAKFNVEMTSCGKVGWTSGRDGYLYSATDPSGKPWPDVPEILRQATERALRVAGLDTESYRMDSVLMNRYSGANKLGMHRDVDEKSIDPVVSFSFGAEADMAAGEDVYRLSHGTVCILSGPSRNILHGIPRVYYTEEHPVRYNLTVRPVSERVLEQAVERAHKGIHPIGHFSAQTAGLAPVSARTEQPARSEAERVAAKAAVEQRRAELRSKITEEQRDIASGTPGKEAELLAPAAGGLSGTVVGSPTVRGNEIVSFSLRDMHGQTHRVIAKEEMLAAARLLQAGDAVTVQGEVEQRPLPGGGLVAALQATSIVAGREHDRMRARLSTSLPGLRPTKRGQQAQRDAARTL